MDIIRLYDRHDLRLEDKPMPEKQTGMVRLKIASVGICGSDVHYLVEGGTGSLQLDHPLILGHEFSAWVDEGPNKGQLVAVDPAIPCGQCEYCLEGNPNFCTALAFAGSEDMDGGLQAYLNWPAHLLVPLPEGFTPQEGAMLEPLGIAIHAQRLGKVSPGMDVGVFGAGPIGLLTIQMARVAGAGRIFATDRIESRLAYARECGATHTFLADGSEAEAIQAATNGRGVDVAFEAAGDDGAAVNTAILASKRGATLVLIGIPSEDQTIFTASAARRRGLTIKLVRRMKHTYTTAVRLVSQGLVDLKPLITHEFAPEDFEKAFDIAANREGIKVFINFPK
ncbi:zinc-binding dehydrogenase [bacterium]|nr:zinc-binding dehydrogenase [bacterium]